LSGRHSLRAARCSESAHDASEHNHDEKAQPEPRIGSAPFIHARHDRGHAGVGLPAPLTVRWIHASIAMHHELLVNGIRQHNEHTSNFLPRIGSSPFIKARRDSARAPHLSTAVAVESEVAPPFSSSAVMAEPTLTSACGGCAERRWPGG
jgi:hypothetical protein